jgi:ATP-binding cassette subfamily F protein uup
LDNRERLGIVGPNGAGKSTLLEIIAKRIEPTEGSVQHGSTAVVEVFDQQGRELDPSIRLRDAVVGPDGEPSHVHASLMEAFWFDEDTQWAPIELLSGGERRRLQLLITLARQPNVLLLDEPTNDLDLDTLRQLEDFLEVFPGAVVVVSHDRAFLERVVADVLVIDHGSARKLPGGYAAYEADRARRRGSQKAAAVPGGAGGSKDRPKNVSESERVRGGQAGGGPAGGSGTPQKHGTSPKHGSPQKQRSPSTLRHRMRATERAMAEAKATVEALLLEVEQASVRGDHEALSGLSERLGEAQRESEASEEEWLELAAEMEERGLDF